MTLLDQQIDASLQDIARRRKTKLTLVVVGLLMAIGTMIGLTLLMYSPSGDDVSKDRVGTESPR